MYLQQPQTVAVQTGTFHRTLGRAVRSFMYLKKLIQAAGSVKIKDGGGSGGTKSCI